MGTVALAHDYLTQRGGAERVVLSMLEAFPDAPLHTSLYEPTRTFPDFVGHDVRTLPLNRLGPLRRHHRWGLPLYPQSFSSLRVEADVVLCSSSGWAHGVQTSGYKLVYCHSPARWLYQRERYLRESPKVLELVVGAMAPYLRRWDTAAAASAQGYLANSRAVQQRIRQAYGIEAGVLAPPHSVAVDGASQEVDGLEAGFVLCVSRLLPYKNVDEVIRAFRRPGLVDCLLVVVGEGPDQARLAELAGGNVRLLGSVSDAQLRWLYASCSGLVAASHEDYGLTPLEAAAFGKPTAALRWGGYLDTVDEEATGLFFEQPDRDQIAVAIEALLQRSWSTAAVMDHAAGFQEWRFIEKLQAIVAGVPPL
ncbi:MAG: Glycosyltransferase [uncultured Acidimicrobiales bacterium]|uniref:Glycosyltransferase n=1 Tax=uncultured Acidimicrobiales bacterium TaxID=310071 RepID=A0A6J4I9S8_9ACTN|nr:MAG: Glycosyltransferase [uncultured Acidimicrobiales bacterium]